jgi:hypothetical protein
MITRQLLIAVKQMSQFGSTRREIKVHLKNKFHEKEIDEAFWWFDYYEMIEAKKEEEVNKRKVLLRINNWH